MKLKLVVHAFPLAGVVAPERDFIAFFSLEYNPKESDIYTTSTSRTVATQIDEDLAIMPNQAYLH
ncbi:MAG: hypothetical protein GEV13_31855 [Rhodospirillales bacterium]|nr:hypothetical protein [Rhodospirillales bacterium]